MIYIPFFIVILIDKRDDKRDDKRTIHSGKEKKKGMTPPTHRHTQHSTTAQGATPRHQRKKGMTTPRHTTA